MYSNSINVVPSIVITLSSFCWVACIFAFVGMAKLFMKAGEKWWKIFIHIYNDYIFCNKGCKSLYCQDDLSNSIYFGLGSNIYRSSSCLVRAS